MGLQPMLKTQLILEQEKGATKDLLCKISNLFTETNVAD